jgi:hypothetical protein
LAAADDNGSRFGHHCCRWTSPNSIKYRGQQKLINFYFNLWNLLKRFDGGIGKHAQGRPPLRRHGFIKSMLLEGRAAPPPW